MAAKSIAIVTRNGAEFATILQEEARRLGLIDQLRVEPRLLLLTPLGRFALSLYDMTRTGKLEITPDRFETMIASGWLGAAVQRTVRIFTSVRAQSFDQCSTLGDWETAFEQLTALTRTAPELARLPSSGVEAGHIETWYRALKQIVDLHGRLFDNRPKSIAEHIKRLRDELSQLNPNDFRNDERELVERIILALQEVVGGSELQVDDREMGDLLSGMARGEEDNGDAPEDNKVWVTTPESIDSVPPDQAPHVIFYLGLDQQRVPRPSSMPWPFFELDLDADAERERYLFLAVERRVKLDQAPPGRVIGLGPQTLQQTEGGLRHRRFLEVGSPMICGSESGCKHKLRHVLQTAWNICSTHSIRRATRINRPTTAKPAPFRHQPLLTTQPLSRSICTSAFAPLALKINTSIWPASGCSVTISGGPMISSTLPRVIFIRTRSRFCFTGSGRST